MCRIYVQYLLTVLNALKSRYQSSYRLPPWTERRSQTISQFRRSLRVRHQVYVDSVDRSSKRYNGQHLVGSQRSYPDSLRSLQTMGDFRGFTTERILFHLVQSTRLWSYFVLSDTVSVDLSLLIRKFFLEYFDRGFCVTQYFFFFYISKT